MREPLEIITELKHVTYWSQPNIKFNETMELLNELETILTPVEIEPINTVVEPIIIETPTIQEPIIEVNTTQTEPVIDKSPSIKKPTPTKKSGVKK